MGLTIGADTGILLSQRNMINRYRKRINFMTIVDAHIHPFISHENNIAPFGSPVTLDEFMMELKHCGFDRVCGSVLIRHRCSFEEVQQANRIALKIRELYPDFYVPGLQVHAGNPEGSCRELEIMYREHHVCWIGELVQHSMGTGEYNSPGMFKIYETARDLGMPVNIHCGDLVTVEDVLRNFPTLPLILAHPGDLNMVKERLALIRKYPNACIDISGTGLFRWNMLRYAVDQCGSEKILFGTDFPVCSAAMNLGGVMGEHLTDMERENILGRNFLRLTGQNQPAEKYFQSMPEKSAEIY